MQTSHKNFIKSLGEKLNYTAQQIAFLLANKTAFVTMNIQRGKNGIIEFDIVMLYYKIMHVVLNPAEQKLWDLFNDFKSPKNAIATLYYCLENKAQITPQILKDQGKLTPKRDLPKINNFVDFYATLTPEEKTQLLAIADKWLKTYHLDKSSFDFFFINGTNGTTFAKGDYLIMYDQTMGEMMATKVLHASPDGYVTGVDNGGHFTISASCQPRKATKEEIPAEILEILDTTYTKIEENTEEHKITTLDKVMARFERDEEEAKKAEEKAEKLAKKEAEEKAKIEARDKAFNELQSLKLNDQKAINDAVDKFNKAGLSVEQKDTIRKRIKEAKEKLTAKATAKTETATAPATKATTPAKTTAKINAKPLRKEPGTAPAKTTAKKATPAKKAEKK